MALSWRFEDEATPETDAVLMTLRDTYVEVPALFPFELQNILRAGERRGRVTRAGVATFWKQLLVLDIRIEPYGALTDEPELVDLSRDHNLTSYDACYLDIALRRGLPLATLDKALRAAASACDVPVLG